MHDQRVAADPDFRYTAEEIAAVEALRNEKSVSLNLEKRKAEREERTKEQLARENERRTAQGAPPLKSVDEVKDPPDAILSEAAQIAADLSRLEPRFLTRVRPAT